jgi:hypothetical protein
MHLCHFCAEKDLLTRPHIVALIIWIALLLSCSEEKQGEEAGEEIPATGGGISSGGNQGVSSRAIASAPTGFTFSSNTADSIKFTWTDTASNELIYEVEMCSGQDCETFEPVPGSPLPADSIEHEELALLPASAFRFRIRATNRNGSSNWLSSGNVWTKLAQNSEFNLIEATPSSLTFSWTSSSSDHESVAIERCQGADCTNFQALFGSPFDAPISAKSEAGLSADTIYRYRVKAISETTESAWLTSTNLSTLVSAVAPSNASLTTISDTSVTLNWQDNSSSELIYEVERCAGVDCVNFSAVSGSPLAANTTTYTDINLTPSTTYKFRVRNTSSSGSSAWLESSEFKSAPEMPTGLSIDDISATSITISWMDEALDETAYEVESCTGSSCLNFTPVSASPLSSNATTHSASSLSDDTIYRFRIRAVRAGIASSWLTSTDITTLVGASSCSAPITKVIDRGEKSNSTNIGRGLWSDTKMIPGTRRPATAFYDGSATGGAQNLKLSWWNGTSFQVESVAGDSRVAVGSATFVRLAFLSNGRPMVFWTTGNTIVKGAIRSAALTSTGTWTAAVLDTVTGAASRSLEVAVSPLDHVALIYLTNTTTAGRARFIYCGAGCSSLTSMVPMTASGDTIEAANVTAAHIGTGIAWCKHNDTTYYPAVTYPATGAIRYASCTGSLSSCQTAAGWSGRYTNVVTTAGTISKLYLDSTIVGDTPKIITRNAANTLMQAFQMNQACNATAPYTFTAGNTFGAATSGSAWANIMKGPDNTFHVVTNLGTTNVSYHNSTTTNFATTAWNAGGLIDTLTLPAAGSGAGGAAINPTDSQIYTSYGGSAAPFNIFLGVVADTGIASSSASAIFYTHNPDLSGGINNELATGSVRNLAIASTAIGHPGAAYIDSSIGVAAGSKLKYAFRAGTNSNTTWVVRTLPNTSTPSFPSLAYDHLDKPWISYYDSATFRYYLMTNESTDGSGSWSQYQFPITGKTATATAPATDDTALVMYYTGATAKPLMIVANSTGAGGTGIRAALFDPSISSFTNYTTVDTLGGSFATSLSADNDLDGNIVVSYYDITATRAKFSYTSNAQTWLGTPVQVSAATVGREGLKIRIDRETGRPGMSYYDRANNSVFYSICTENLDSCAQVSNWSTSIVSSAAGVSGISTAYEQLLGTALNFDAESKPYITYMTGISAATQMLGIATLNGTFTTTPLLSSSSSAVSGASATNFAMAGYNASSVITANGDLVTVHVGPNNWLYSTSCEE